MNMKSILILCMALVLSGCITSTQDKYYLLEAQRPASKAAISLRRLDLPPYLEQNNFVRRCKGNRIEYIEGHSWACSLKHALEEGLNDALTADTPRSISLKVRRFEVADDNVFHVSLDCIEGKRTTEITFDFPCDSRNAAAIAAAYGKSLVEIQKRLSSL